MRCWTDIEWLGRQPLNLAGGQTSNPWCCDIKLDDAGMCRKFNVEDCSHPVNEEWLSRCWIQMSFVSPKKQETKQVLNRNVVASAVGAARLRHHRRHAIQLSIVKCACNASKESSKLRQTGASACGSYMRCGLPRLHNKCEAWWGLEVKVEWIHRQVLHLKPTWKEELRGSYRRPRRLPAQFLTGSPCRLFFLGQLHLWLQRRTPEASCLGKGANTAISVAFLVQHVKPEKQEEKQLVWLSLLCLWSVCDLWEVRVMWAACAVCVVWLRACGGCCDAFKSVFGECTVCCVVCVHGVWCGVTGCMRTEISWGIHGNSLHYSRFHFHIQQLDPRHHEVLLWRGESLLLQRNASYTKRCEGPANAFQQWRC